MKLPAFSHLAASLVFVGLGLDAGFADPSTSLGAKLERHALAMADDSIPPFVNPCGAIVFEEEPQVWAFTGGASVRSIDTASTFNGSSVKPNFTPYQGKGNVGIYSLGGKTVYYDDGYVTRHDHPFFSHRAAGGYVNSSKQVSAHPLGYEFDGIVNHIVSFHTDSVDYSRDNEDPSNSDSNTGVGPFLQLVRQLSVCKSLDINLVASWTFLSTDEDQGPQAVASLTGDRTLYTYQYDHITNALVPQSLPGYVGGVQEMLVLDPSKPFGGLPPGYRAPRQSESSGSSLVYQALATSNLDVKLNEIAFGVEAGRNCGPLQLLLTGGLTLNVIDYNLSSQAAWYDSAGNRVSSIQTFRDSGTPLKVGLYGGVVARCNLSKSGNFFVESSGTYRWVDPVHASDGLTSVEIDPSSFEGRFGFGIRF